MHLSKLTVRTWSSAFLTLGVGLCQGHTVILMSRYVGLFRAHVEVWLSWALRCSFWLRDSDIPANKGIWRFRVWHSIYLRGSVGSSRQDVLKHGTLKAENCVGPGMLIVTGNPSRIPCAVSTCPLLLPSY